MHLSKVRIQLESPALKFQSLQIRSYRSIYHFYAKGASYEEMHSRNREVRSEWLRYIPETTFKYIVDGYNRTISQSRRKEIIESFSYMRLLGKIDMKNPEATFGCFEECAFSSPKNLVLKFTLIRRGYPREAEKSS